MGLDSASVMFLCAARARGVDFRRTATIGRQALVPNPAVLRRVFAALQVDEDVDAFLRANDFGEPFFSLLGAEEVVALDYSAYEGAQLIHDMNQPIPEHLRQRFSVVHDGGSLEHIFNVPQALKNCMEMVEVGGHFTQVNVANNLMGHGFWQFSPELIYRAFDERNGYEVDAVLMHELVDGGGWFSVADPDEIHSRVELCNALPTYIVTIARRVADVEVFATPPQQSDYVAAWRRGAAPPLDATPEPTPPTSGYEPAHRPRWRTYVRRAARRGAP